MEIEPIKTEVDYVAAIRRIEAVWGAAPGTVVGDELEVLVTLVEAYEGALSYQPDAELSSCFTPGADHKKELALPEKSLTPDEKLQQEINR